MCRRMAHARARAHVSPGILNDGSAAMKRTGLGRERLPTKRQTTVYTGGPTPVGGARCVTVQCRGANTGTVASGDGGSFGQGKRRGGDGGGGESDDARQVDNADEHSRYERHDAAAATLKPARPCMCVCARGAAPPPFHRYHRTAAPRPHNNRSSHRIMYYGCARTGDFVVANRSAYPCGACISDTKTLSPYRSWSTTVGCYQIKIVRRTGRLPPPTPHSSSSSVPLSLPSSSSFFT